MSESEGRTHALIDLSPDALEALLRAALPGRKHLAAVPLTGGFLNTIYRIVAPDLDESFILRLYSREAMIAETEVALARFLQDRVPVPEVIYADTTGEIIGHPAVVSRYVDGVLLDRILLEADASDIDDMGEAVGAVLADIAAVRFPCPGFFGPDLQPTPFPGTLPNVLRAFVRERLFQGPAGTVLGEEVRDRLWEMVEREAPLLDAVDGARSLVHSDFNGKNIIMAHESSRWRVAAVLDWEFAFSSTPLFDIGNMLRFSEELPPAYQSAFIRSFEENGGALPENWRKLARLLDVSALCDFLTRDPGHAFFSRARDLILSSVARGEV